jgi:HD-like signal output (HDOD) protein
MKHRILFVDDDELVLQGLQRMLRCMRGSWEMEFVTSGKLALERLAESAYDAVVTDIRMPGMNGPELLGEVMGRYPQTVRLILSGQADEESVMKSVGVAHQYLSKPCDPEELKAAVSRAFSTGTALNNPHLKRVVSQLDHVPSLPSLYSKMLRQLQDPDVNLEEVASTVASDIGMTAKILKLLNSAYFGPRREISDVREAVAYLGTNTLKTLVLAIHAFGQFEGEASRGFSLDQLWTHSLEVAATARRICLQEHTAPTLSEQAFIAGLLHDVGQLILVASLAAEYSGIIETARTTHQQLHKVEAATLGTTHAEVGGYLLGLWGLPVMVVEAISSHHQPRVAKLAQFGILTAVHVAEELHISAIEGDDHSPEPAPDLEYLASLGLADRLPVWKESMSDLSLTIA